MLLIANHYFIKFMVHCKKYEHVCKRQLHLHSTLWQIVVTEYLVVYKFTLHCNVYTTSNKGAITLFAHLFSQSVSYVIVISLPGGWSFYTFVSGVCSLTPMCKTTPQRGI